MKRLEKQLKALQDHLTNLSARADKAHGQTRRRLKRLERRTRVTVERTVRRRKDQTIYVDYLQNIQGKTLACAYSARASEFAGVSTPLTWKEVDEGVDPRDFTIVTAPKRFAEVGDLWARLRTSKPANLETVFRKYAKSGMKP